MPHPTAAAIDCDLHPAVPSLAALLPYLDDHWREAIEQRGVDELNAALFPPDAPISRRAGWNGRTLDDLRAEALEPFGSGLAIANCPYGVPMLFSEDMAAGIARALNQWIAREFLDREPRLRASIIVAPQNAEYAVDEIERCAADPRFVPVLLPVADELPPGRRAHWPIYAAAVRHGLPVGFHGGSTYKHPTTPWPGCRILALQASAYTLIRMWQLYREAKRAG